MNISTTKKPISTKSTKSTKNKNSSKTNSAKNKENILLVHGILMNPIELRYLGKQLEKLGYTVHYVFYQSVLKTPEENARVIYTKIKRLKLPNLHIVAHSLGGVITMHLLNQFNDLPLGRVVMLGTPVNGSWIAQKIHKWPVISPFLAKSMPSALSGENIPEWNNKRKWGMIAGIKNQGWGFVTGGLPGKSDGTVLLEETKHPQQTDHICVDTSHTGLVFSKEVAQLCCHFLSKGSFNS